MSLKYFSHDVTALYVGIVCCGLKSIVVLSSVRIVNAHWFNRYQFNCRVPSKLELTTSQLPLTL